MSDLDDAVERGLDNAFEKTAQRGVSQAVRKLPDFLLSTAPRSTMNLAENALSGHTGPRTLARGASDITEDLRGQLADRAYDVYRQKGPQGLMDLAGQRYALGRLSNDLGQVAEQSGATGRDLMTAISRNPVGLGTTLNLARRSGQNPGPPRWLLPAVGAGSGALGGAVMS